MKNRKREIGRLIGAFLTAVMLCSDMGLTAYAAETTEQDVLTQIMGEIPQEESVSGNDADAGETVSENDADAGETVSENDADAKETVSENDADAKETVSENDADAEESVSENDIEDMGKNLQAVAELDGDVIASGEYKEDGNDITWVIDSAGKLMVEGTGDYTGDSTAFGRAPWYQYRESITSAKINVTGLKNAFGMFYKCGNLESIDLSGFDTSQVTAMHYMFYGCGSLTSLDVSGFDTSKVTNMECMFCGCGSLTNLDVSGFDTSNVEDMGAMFSDCSGLTSLNVSGFKTGNVTGMRYMFFGCSSLTCLDLSSFDTSHVTSMEKMFSGCSSLTSLDLRGFDAGGVKDSEDMLNGCDSLRSIRTPYNLRSRVDLPTGVWYQDQKTRIMKLPTNLDHSILIWNDEAAVVNVLRVVKGKTSYRCGDILTLDDLTVTYYDAAGAAHILTEGDYTTNASEIDMSTPGKKILTVTYSRGGSTFEETIELGVTEGKVVASGTDQEIVWMIDADGKLTVEGRGDVSKGFSDPMMWRPREPWYEYRDAIESAEIKVTGMTDASTIFYDCGNLSSLDMSAFDTSRITNMESMFYGCGSLTSLDVSGFDTSKVTNMKSMFMGCSSLTSLDVSGFDTGNVTNMYCMFYDCGSLQRLDLRSFDASGVGTAYNMFYGCNHLQTVHTPYNLKASVLLPIGSWYQVDGTQVTELPTNLDHSVIVQRDAPPVEIALESIAISENTLSLKTGEKARLTVRLVPENATSYPAITWTSSDTTIAEVRNGIVKAVAAGACTITAAAGDKKGICEITVADDSVPVPGDKVKGLQVMLAGGEEYTYTGSAIKPAVIVVNNGEELVEGTDYTIRYSNNVKAANKAAGRKAPTVIVTGKGNLTKSRSLTFTIKPKNIGDEEDVIGSSILVESSKNGKTALPVLYYGNVKLTAKDYDNPNAKKKYTADETITITGKGNFEGTREIAVKVIEKAEMKKFKVVIDTAALKQNPLIYDGEAKTMDGYFKVYDTKDKTKSHPLKKNRDYTVIYPKNNINAGNVKFTIMGLGNYCGTVTKTYTIKPRAVKTAADGNIQVNVNDGVSYLFQNGGVTIPGLSVICDGKVLVLGKDYRVTYSGNKKVCSNNKAKCTISFIGNYKGSKAIVRKFNITPAALDDAGAVSAVAGDAVYAGRPGVYKSIPYITANGTLLKSADYKVSYYLDPERKQAMNGKTVSGKVDLMSQDRQTVYVEITGKGNYKGSVDTEYNVCKQTAEAVNLAKARVSIVGGNKKEYTGEAVEPAVKITYKSGKEWKTVDANEIGTNITVTYFNNVSRGKATVLINGNGGKYVGSKTAVFNIVQKSMK